MKKQKVYLCLENGQTFEGYRFGAGGEIQGELVFTTGMGGYIETLTDPSYYGQIVLQTFPLIGNYGFIPEDMESPKSYVSAYIVREYCQVPSNFRCRETLDDFLKSQGIIGVYGVDTREITKTIRESGVMNAVICDDPRVVDYNKVRDYAVADAVKSVSAPKPQLLSADEHKHNVVLLDYGAKANIARELNKRGCNVAVMPYNTKAEDILALHPDGIMLSRRSGREHRRHCSAEKAHRKSAYFWHLPGAPTAGAGYGLQDGKTEIRSPWREPAGKRPANRANLYLQSKPRLRGSERYH